MERNLFPSKPSFAFLAWIVVIVSILTNHAIIDTFTHLSNKVYATINTTLISTASAQTNSKVNITYSKKSENFVPKVSEADVQCMATNIYNEASTQSYVGKMAVGLVVLNRLKSSGYPDTVCGVIYEGSQNVHTSTCQFSWTCNPHSAINTNSYAWFQSLSIANDLLANQNTVIDITEGATSYHANYVKPIWAKHLKRVTQIDQHIFYSAK